MPTPNGFLFALNKEPGLTSHDCVDEVRKIFQIKKVGHAGTLDPMASGVLIMGVGAATKILGRLALDEKSYKARIIFGVAMDTDDAEGVQIATAPVPGRLANEAFGRELLKKFIGEQLQMPPKYSAIKKNGKRSYAEMRKGLDVQLDPRRVVIKYLSLDSIDESAGNLTYTVSCTVSKGTYIRSLARDIGEAAGTYAHLSALERTQVGSVGLDQCVTLEDLSHKKNYLDYVLDPVKLLHLPTMALTDSELRLASLGNSLQPPKNLKENAEVCLLYNGCCYGIWQERNEELRPKINIVQGIKGVC